MTEATTATAPPSLEDGAVRLCTKCGKHPRVGKNKPWCRECYRSHAEEYRAKIRPPRVTEERECAFWKCENTFTWSSTRPTRQYCSSGCAHSQRWWDARPEEDKDPEGAKWCIGCDETKVEAEWSPSQYAKKRGAGRCRDCMKKYGKTWKDKNREKASAATRRSRARRLLRQYGAYTDDIDKIVADQGGVCASCGLPPDGVRGFHIDHHHETLRFRALLCHGCNTGLGAFQDDPARLLAAVEYLRRFA